MKQQYIVISALGLHILCAEVNRAYAEGYVAKGSITFGRDASGRDVYIQSMEYSGLNKIEHK